MMPTYSVSSSQMTTTHAQRPAQHAFSVCNLVDEQGREVRITEAMIMTACETLRRRCRLPKAAPAL